MKTKKFQRFWFLTVFVGFTSLLPFGCAAETEQTKQTEQTEQTKQIESVSHTLKTVSEITELLYEEEYNLIVETLEEDQIAVAIISNQKHFWEVLTYVPNMVVYDYLVALEHAEFELIDTQPYGYWGAEVNILDAGWEHGTMKGSNYGVEGYFLYYVNRSFAQLGISSQTVDSDKQILEFTYNF